MCIVARNGMYQIGTKDNVEVSDSVSTTSGSDESDAEDDLEEVGEEDYGDYGDEVEDAVDDSANDNVEMNVKAVCQVSDFAAAIEDINSAFARTGILQKWTNRNELSVSSCTTVREIKQMCHQVSTLTRNLNNIETTLHDMLWQMGDASGLDMEAVWNASRTRMQLVQEQCAIDHLLWKERQIRVAVLDIAELLIPEELTDELRTALQNHRDKNWRYLQDFDTPSDHYFRVEGLQQRFNTPAWTEGIKTYNTVFIQRFERAVQEYKNNNFWWCTKATNNANDIEMWWFTTGFVGLYETS